MSAMNFQKIAVPVLGIVLFAMAYRSYGWAGVALVLGGLVMWGLLHFTRMTQVLTRASKRPVGFVDSAVMLNAKLKPGVQLLHVLALTRALGALRSPKDTQPELFRWTDGTDSYVDCEFLNGKLVKWELVRPVQPAEPVEPAEPAALAPPAP
jgi:hypothetical protein